MIPRFAIQFIFVLAVEAAAFAQDRMPPIPREKMADAQKKAADELISGRRGALVGPFHPLLRSPELMSRLQKTGEYLRFSNSIGPKLTELVILLTAREWTQQFEFNAHQPLGLKAGLKQELVAAIADGRRPAMLAEDEEIVYDFCTELHRTQSVSDATYTRAVGRFGEQGVIDMTGLTGYYTVLAMIMNVARTPLPEGAKPPLALFPR